MFFNLDSVIGYMPIQTHISHKVHYSQLHSVESDLATACYLFQGFPDMIYVTKFAYTSGEAADFEYFLACILSGKVKCAKETKAGLTLLCKSCYLTTNGRVIFKWDRKVANLAYSNLNSLIKDRSLGIKEMALDYLLLFYLDDSKSGRWTYLSKYKLISDKRIAVRIASNITNLTRKTDRFIANDYQSLSHPYPIR